MNSHQFNHDMKFVFSELQSSGLPVSSEVFVVLTKLFSSYKVLEQVRDEANLRSIQYFNEAKLLRSKVSDLNAILAALSTTI